MIALQEEGRAAPDQDGGPERPHKHAAYGALTAAFALGVGALLLSMRNAGRRHLHDGGARHATTSDASAPDVPAPPSDGIPWRDLLLLGIATHKIARIIAKDRVTQPIRAPFTEQEGGHRRPKGGALRHSVGELVTCPYCVAPWITLAMGTAYVHAPDATRLGAGLFTVVSVSDFLNRGYARLGD